MYLPQPLTWDASLSTGDHDLDTQHKYLFEICNDLAKAIEKKRGSEVIGMVLDVLTFYAEWHFKKEETCMERHQCLMADQNLKAHSVFMSKLKESRAAYQAADSPEELAIRMHQFLTDWIIRHIMHMDTQLYMAIHPQTNDGLQTSTQ